jgi:hypothetical protein
LLCGVKFVCFCPDKKIFLLPKFGQHTYVVHLLSEGVPSREDTFLSWHLAPVSQVTRGLSILESADHALFKMVRYVLLRPLWPELDAKTKTCLPAKTRFCHLDEQATTLSLYSVESTARAVTILMQQLKNYVRLLDNFILVKMFNLLS